MTAMARHPRLLAISLLWFATSSPVAMAELNLSAEPLEDTELSELRGGFQMDNLEIAIGLEQIVAVNGETMVVNRLTIPNLNQVVSGRGVDHQFETVLEMVGPNQGRALVSGNMGGSDGWMTLVQNSLDSTVIQNIHQLNIELNNLGGGNPFPARFNDQLVQLLGR